MSAIHFETELFTINSWIIARLPEEASKQLPSRSQVAVVGVMNGHEFRTVLEPDGNFGHWIHVTEQLQKNAKVTAGDMVTVELEVTKDWPEPIMPDDFAAALKTAPEKVKEKWQDITPMARNEWVRWIGATNNLETRAVRIEKSISKLNGKHRRPCCFNLAACTVMEVSKSGVLLPPATT